VSEAEWIISNVFPDYDPSLDWVGTNGGHGELQGTLLDSVKAGDVLKTVDGHCSVVRYVDRLTLVTRQQ